MTASPTTLPFLVNDPLAPRRANNESTFTDAWKHCIARRFVEKSLQAGVGLQKIGLGLFSFLAQVLFGRLGGERGKADGCDTERGQRDVVDFHFHNFPWFVISLRLIPSPADIASLTIIFGSFGWSAIGPWSYCGEPRSGWAVLLARNRIWAVHPAELESAD